jgi:hypothetical protein
MNVIENIQKLIFSDKKVVNSVGATINKRFPEETNFLVGKSGKYLKVNQDETDFEFASGGGGGSDLPVGGTTGQVLAKKTDTDFDIEWKSISTPFIYKETLVNAESGSYSDNDIVYVNANKTFYIYSSNSSLVRDGKLILNTSLAGNTRLLAFSGSYCLGGNGLANSGIQIGTVDAFSRGQIWNNLPNASMRLGSLAQDGDPINSSAEGVIVYGANSAGTFDQLNWAFARIKSTRIGINNCIANVQFYLFRADEVGLYLKKDDGSKCFEVIRSTGEIKTNNISAVSGSFTSQDGKTITVTNGLITGIV